MTISQAIEKAIEGGWIYKNEWGNNPIDMPVERILLDPLFWQSLGKAMGWDESSGIFREPGHVEMKEWMFRWHDFTDHLIEGKTAESFFANL